MIVEDPDRPFCSGSCSLLYSHLNGAKTMVRKRESPVLTSCFLAFQEKIQVSFPYAVEREIEDIGALITEAGRSAFVYGSSGPGILSMYAAAAGLSSRIKQVRNRKESVTHSPSPIMQSNDRSPPRLSIRHLRIAWIAAFSRRGFWTRAQVAKNFSWLAHFLVSVNPYSIAVLARVAGIARDA